MKLKRGDFNVLIPSENVGEEGEGAPSTGVEPFEPDPSEGKPKPKDGKEGDDKKDKKDKDKEKSKGGSGSGDDSGDDDGDDEKSSGGKGPELTKKVEKVSGKGIGATLTPEQSAKLQEELGVPVEIPTDADGDKIKEQAKRGMSNLSTGGPAGKGKGLLRRAIARLTQPQIDWKSALKKFIGKAMSNSEIYLGSRRHLHTGEYLYGEKWKFDALQNAVVAVDTSGSMSNEAIELILSEISGIIKAKKIKNTEVVYFDGVVQDVDVINNTKKIFDLTKAKGGGGTNFKPPMQYMFDKWKKGKLDLAVFCTDGYNSDNPLPIPTYKNIFVWVILDNPEYKPPFGQLCVHISKKDVGL